MPRDDRLRRCLGAVTKAGWQFHGRLTGDGFVLSANDYRNGGNCRVMGRGDTLTEAAEDMFSRVLEYQNRKLARGDAED